ncbi:MAG TPA: hypothetical protein VKP13_05375 [Nitrospira sp.]|nr:hypothetical protein [Nitrospira sp.]
MEVELGDDAGLLDVVLAGAAGGLDAVAAGVLAGLAVASFFSPLAGALFSPSVGGFILSE